MRPVPINQDELRAMDALAKHKALLEYHRWLKEKRKQERLAILKETCRIYYLKNKDRMLKYAKKYYAKNREYFLAYQVAYRKRRKDQSNPQT